MSIMLNEPTTSNPYTTRNLPRYNLHGGYDIAAAVQIREPFAISTGNFRGFAVPYDRVAPHCGWLADGNHMDAYRQYQDDCLDDRVDYVVMSFGTPIAWYTRANEWRFEDGWFSYRTRKHQSVVRRAMYELVQAYNSAPPVFWFDGNEG